jgi:hypothetical protein
VAAVGEQVEQQRPVDVGAEQGEGLEQGRHVAAAAGGQVAAGFGQQCGRDAVAVGGLGADSAGRRPTGSAR